ncbi:MAG: BCD family MFS transporter, partial [Gammaproteobacteria bacterium]|nr:BCD family MFS transporter [Gammaproteobacteria bacterium]
AEQRLAGICLAALAFVFIGLGVGAAGTSLLALLAKRVAPDRRAAAASMVWIMMIMGFVVTATTAGFLLEPFSLGRLVAVTTAVALGALALTTVAIWGVEGSTSEAAPVRATRRPVPFAVALRDIWDEPRARRFSIFVFISMLAYSAQDLILEPFAGLVFGLTPGESTRLAGVQHSGVLLGMLVVAFAGRYAPLKYWTAGGCAASALALAALALGGYLAPVWPLKASVFALGLANGAFAVAAIGSMMGLAGAGRAEREGMRMGLFGAAQAIAFGLGGFLGTAGVDAMRYLSNSPVTAYAAVFIAQALLFLVAASLAIRIERPASVPATLPGAGSLASAR